MKKYILTLALLWAMNATHGQEQGTPIDQVLNNIERNNKQFQATMQGLESQKLEVRTDNNLPDPTVSYAHMWGKHDSSESISELSVSQSFDFPTVYASRSKLNNLKMAALDSQAASTRRDIMLQAKEICLDIIMLRQQKSILDERLNNARQLAGMYAERLQSGDANILETNKINLELLNVKTEAAMNETALSNKLLELRALNGNEPIEFAETSYPAVYLPDDYNELKTDVINADIDLYALDMQAAAARQEVSLNKSQWLPRLELGYRRNTESGNPFNGVVVGFSIPLFENRNKVKMARTQKLNLDFQKDNRLLEVESELAQLYREALTARAAMQEYEKTFAVQSDLELLKQALAGGEISMIEYFVEVSVVYQSKLNYLQLQNQYHKAVARIYKGNI